MNKLHKFVISLFLMAILIPALSFAKTEETDFDFILVLTRQDMNMDWWFAVPAQFLPNVSQVSEVSKGEFFKIIPIFSNYGLSKHKKAKISYSVEIIAPDGTVDEMVNDIDGFSGEIPGPFLLPSIGRLAVSFDPEDMFGEYDVRVIAYDHIKNKKSSHNQRILLQEFDLEKQDLNSGDWFFSYPSAPKPVLALKAYINFPRSYFDKDETPLWSALWFFKYIFSENEFLIPHTINFYNNKANQQQKRDILLLFHLLNRVDDLVVDEGLREYVKQINKIKIPDPYQKITSGSQLDMLWAEFFASSRIKPIKQIMTALNLGVHSGTIEKFKSGGLGKTDEIRNKMLLEAVFQSAVWSIMSNCKQSQLLFKYCVGLYESNELNETEKGYLGFMLRKVSEEKQKATQLY
jgi:hypothetical protein